jgi:SAM-dependent methyltransferase
VGSILERPTGTRLRTAVTGLFCDDNALLDAIDARGLSTVLCVGSGISQEPRALAAAGLDVTALDISPVAMRFAGAFPFEPATAGRLFNPMRARAGGIVKFAVGDLLDSTKCCGPFDVIIERRTLQLFSEHERPVALGAVVNRLSPRGILLTHCHDGRWKPPAPRKHVIEPLLGSTGVQIIQHGSALPHEGRAAFVVLSTG